jgi:hypothetical protein
MGTCALCNSALWIILDNLFPHFKTDCHAYCIETSLPVSRVAGCSGTNPPKTWVGKQKLELAGVTRVQHQSFSTESLPRSWAIFW